MKGREDQKIWLSAILQRRPFARWSNIVGHLVAPPKWHDLSDAAATFTTELDELVRALGLADAGFGQEYEALSRDRSVVPDEYPDIYKVGDRTAQLLHHIVRQLKPEVTVELGVADGRSTGTILSALDANGTGRLVSVDIDDNVGQAVRGHPRWTLRVHTLGQTIEQLEALLTELGPVDLFFHDGAHSYNDQYAEYRLGYDALRPGGLFISDDIDWSWAFLDLTRARGIRPCVLADVPQAVGAFRK